MTISVHLNKLDWELVRSHYDERVATHERLIELLETGQTEEFANKALAIGPENVASNYSAAEHGLGQKVLIYNSRGNRSRPTWMRAGVRGASLLFGT